MQFEGSNPDQPAPGIGKHNTNFENLFCNYVQTCQELDQSMISAPSHLLGGGRPFFTGVKPGRWPLGQGARQMSKYVTCSFNYCAKSMTNVHVLDNS